MPNSLEFRDIYSKVIKPTINSVGLQVVSSIDYVSDSDLQIRVSFEIKKSAIVVADLSLNNTNVYYELGLAHASGKTTILLSQQSEKLPFYFAQFRVIKYQNTDIGLSQLKFWLSETIESTLKEQKMETRDATRIHKTVKRSASLIEPKTYYVEITNSLLKQASDLQKEGKLKDSVQILEEAASQANSAHESHLSALVFNNLGSAYQELGYYDQALTSFQRALFFLKDIDDKQGLVAAYTNLGGVFERLGSFDQAREFYNRALDLAVIIGDKFTEAKILSNLGDFFQSVGPLEQAYEYYLKATNEFSKLNDIESMAQMNNNLAVLALKMNRYAEAEQLFRQALETFEDNGDLLASSKVWHNIAYILYKKGQLSEAENCLQKSIKTKQTLGDKAGLAASLVLLAQVKLEKGKNADALSDLEKAVKIQEALGDKRGLLDTYLTIANSLNKLGEREKAKKFFSTADFIAKQFDGTTKSKRSWASLKDASSEETGIDVF